MYSRRDRLTTLGRHAILPAAVPECVLMDFASIKLLILDVDGVLTDGRVVRTSHGEGDKRFHVQDGCAIKLWERCGGKVAIISGRGGESVNLRAAELGIEWVHTEITDKPLAYEKVLATAGCDDTAAAYVGDDLPDLAVMRRVGLSVAVADAAFAVKQIADYVTRRCGGCGAVAEVVELLLRKQGRWSRTLLTQL